MSVRIKTAEAPTSKYMLPTVVRHRVASEVKDVNVRKREVTHVISTTREDRAGDIVEVSGAELADYLANPVVLANHDHAIESVIGRAVEITTSGDTMTATTRYLQTPLADTALRLDQAALGGQSIGFIPIETEAIEDKGRLKGFHFKVWSMHEYSKVAIPMNPDAVMRALDAGVPREHVPYFFRAPVPTEDSTPALTEAPRAKAGTSRVVRAETQRAVRDAIRKIERAQGLSQALRGLSHE